MQLTITGRRMEVTPPLNDYVEKKFSRVEKYLKKGADVHVSLSVEKNRHKVEVTINANGLVFRGEEVTADMYASIDQVLDKIENQLKRYKEKTKGHKGKSSPWEENIEMKILSGGEDQSELKVIKTQRHPVKPMSLEEAILQLSLTKNDFMVFTNAETEEVNVIYHRRDGNYGLIEPSV
ncbi:MAG: ribosome-associated translation inhibitor RaiA [bacterium]